MRAIWKYTLEVTDEQPVLMPRGAKLLSVQGQGDDVCLWAEVDAEAPKESRIFCVFGTGQLIRTDHSPRTYVGTAQLVRLGLVFHIFECKSS
jgi:hypothetical protein